MKQLLRDILYELRKQNKKLGLLTKGDWQLESLIQLTVQVNQLSDEIKKLQAIESSKEHNSISRNNINKMVSLSNFYPKLFN